MSAKQTLSPAIEKKRTNSVKASTARSHGMRTTKATNNCKVPLYYPNSLENFKFAKDYVIDQRTEIHGFMVEIMDLLERKALTTVESFYSDEAKSTLSLEPTLKRMGLIQQYRLYTQRRQMGCGSDTIAHC